MEKSGQSQLSFFQQINWKGRSKKGETKEESIAYKLRDLKNNHVITNYELYRNPESNK